MGLFRHRSAESREARGWPRPGLVTVVSAEAQQSEPVSEKVMRRHGTLLAQPSSAGQRWLSEAEAPVLRDELAKLIDG